jgi:hypothetical protein
MADWNKKVFVSYASADRDFCKRLVKHLYDAGIPVWWDEWEIDLGDNIVEKIDQGIQESGFFMLILTPESTAREWVKKEWTSAFMRACDKKDLTIIPILRQDCEIPAVLRGIKHVDFRHKFTKPANELKKFLLGKIGMDSSKENLEETWITTYEKGSAADKLEAIEILLNIGSCRALGTILGDIELQGREVQKKIMKKLKSYLSPSVSANLRRLAHSEDPALASPACTYLATLGDKSKLATLFALAHSEDQEKRITALRNIRLYQNYTHNELRQIVNILINSFQHPFRDVRLTALDTAAILAPQLNRHKLLLIPICKRIRDLFGAGDGDVRQMADTVYRYLQC